MGKLRKSRSSGISKSVKSVTKTAQNVADASIPVIEKGVGAVYGTMATGLDLGVKGAKSITKSMSKKSRSNSRSRSLSGGRRRTRRHRRRH
jgi:hypothetical protein